MDTGGTSDAKLGPSVNRALVEVVPGAMRSCTRLAKASPNSLKPRLSSCKKSFKDFGNFAISSSKLSVETVEFGVDVSCSHFSIESSNDCILL